MKKIIALSLATIMIVAVFVVFNQTPSVAQAESNIVLAVGNNIALVEDESRTIDENFLVVPIISSDRTFTPIRFVAEALGMNVGYDESSRTVSLSGNGNTVVFVIGSSEITVNGETTAIDAASFLSHDRTMLPIRAVSEAIGKNVYYDDGIIVITNGDEPNAAKFAELRGKLGTLPVVGTQENLKRLLEESGFSRNIGFGGGGGLWLDDMATTAGSADLAAAPTPAPAPKSANSEGAMNDKVETESADYSQTNVQVEGVDEADVIKTDGNYIYKIGSNGIVILSADPLSIVSTIEFENDPIELYVDGDILTAIAYKYNYRTPRMEPYLDSGMDYYEPYIYTPPATVCLVYDITNRANPKLQRSFEVEGNYLTSRRINDIVYMVTNQYVYCDDDGYYPTPICKDSATGESEYKIPLETLCYLPNFSDASYTVITSIDTANSKKIAETETYLGAGSNAYVSMDNLYLSSTKYDQNYRESTQIYKFALSNGDVQYLSRAAVPGNILNQFSMDEYHGNFRVVTTEYLYDSWLWSSDTRNNLFIFDEDMQQRGSIVGLAPGERIYSARFVGNRGYMVTFKQVDPLFVMDLEDIDNPTVLGYLKIPGYSDYLHPVDDDHIIGFGMDTTESGDTALMQGFKMALFDISDVHNPKQKFVEIIGGRGTYSELLYNHKALMYSAEKNLLAFPISVTEVTDGLRYGNHVFEGAYVYKFSTDTGFDLQAKLEGNGISRILYAGNRLFTSSYDMVKAYTLDSFDLLKSVKH